MALGNFSSLRDSKAMRKATDIFAIIVGLFLLIEGIWGLSSEVVFGVLTTNTTHAIIHTVLGLVGIATGYLKRARGFCIFLGFLLLAVGALRFVPGAEQLVVRLLNANVAVACLNLVVGLLALIVSFTSAASNGIASERIPPV